jgi:hypothetical protein
MSKCPFPNSKPLAEMPVPGGHFRPMTVNGSPSGRCRQAAETLAGALRGPQYGSALAGELAPLLFPAETNILPDDIAESLSGIANSYGTANA